MISKINITLLFCLFTFVLVANQGIKKSAWEEATKKHNYEETFKEFDLKEKQTKERPTKDFNMPKGLMLLPLAVLGIFLVLLIVLFIKNSTSITISKKVGISDKIEETENPDEFTESDLEKHLNKAIADQNYRLATRIQFLLIIKLLQDNKLIKWRKEKTNFDYLNEINNLELKRALKTFVLVFEKVWYANYPINQATFNKTSVTYKQLTNLIGQHNNK